MAYRHHLKENFKEEVVPDPQAKEGEEDERKAMKNLGEVLRMARAAKLE